VACAGYVGGVFISLIPVRCVPEGLCGGRFGFDPKLLTDPVPISLTVPLGLMLLEARGWSTVRTSLGAREVWRVCGDTGG
jgi:hypothetical protein